MRHLLSVLCMLVFVACASSPSYISPYTSGMQMPGDTFGKAGGPIGRYVVWATHPDAEGDITRILLGMNHIVVERAKIERVFAEQRFSLLHASDAEVLHVGRLIGATDIIFADVTLDPAYSTTRGQRPTVQVRGVQIQTGHVRWSGMATYPSPVREAESVIGPLAWLAMTRAICRAEDWTEHTVDQTAHCNTNHPYYYVTK